MSARRMLFSVNGIAIIGLTQLIILGMASMQLIKNAMAAGEESRRAVVESYETIDMVRSAFNLLLDAEVGERGYVITGNTVFLEPYNNASLQIGGELRRLAANRDPDIVLLGHVIRDKLDHATAMIDIRRTKGLAVAVDRTDTQDGKRLMDAVRSQLAKVIGSEREELARRAAAHHTSESRSQTIIYLVVGGGQLLSLAIGVLLLSHIRRRRAAEVVARRRAALLRATMENVGSGIALLDGAGHLVDRNARLSEFFEVTDHATLILGARELQAARDRQSVNFERSVGEDTAVEVRGHPARDDLYVLTYSDVTDRHRSDRLKNDFISTVSHELRTPLTAIRGALGLLVGPLAAGLPASAVSLLSIADRNALRLMGLVNDLLDIDKIEAGHMTLNLEPLDLNQLAREAVEANRSLAIQRGVTMSFGCGVEPVMVCADGVRLHQVITNLVSNAAKFSPESSVVTITVERIRKSAKVSVHDSGEGIPAEFHKRIFGKFAQAASGDAKRIGGSGLGLHISKSIVEHHGGSIGFASVPGSTLFSFSLATVAS